MRSMSGFGHATASSGDVVLTVDIRAVNNRNLDLRVQVPRELMYLETTLRKQLQRSLWRGRIELFLQVVTVSPDQLGLNEPVVRSYLGLVERIQTLGLRGQLGTMELLSLPGVVTQTPPDYQSEEFSQAVVRVTDEAVARLISAREEEGEALRKDLIDRLEQVAQGLERLKESSAAISSHYREKLMQRVQEVLDTPVVDPGRLAQEILFYTERSDTAEEMTRLASHLERFRSVLQRSEAESAGKVLDILCQEMIRETTTLLAKASAVSSLDAAVEMKVEIEKIREQVQNVE